MTGNIWKYYILRIFAKRLVFPILTIFLVRNNLSPTELGIIFAAGTVIGLILEVPSGVIADRIGHKTAMLFAQSTWAMSMLLFWQADQFWEFFIANAVYWIGGSLWTGTNEAFIYETMRALKRESEIKLITGRALLISQVSTGALFVVVPWIATYSLRLPFLLNAIACLIGAGLTTTLSAPTPSRSVAAVEGRIDRFGWRTFMRNPRLLTTGLTFGFIGGWNGILEDFRQLYLDHIQLDLAYFGLIYLALRLFTGIVGTQVESIEQRIGARATFLLVPAISLTAYIGLAMSNSLYGLLFVALDGLQDGLTRPMEQAYLNTQITGTQRATLLSVFNLLTNLIRALAVLLAGFIISWSGIHAGMWFAAIGFVLIGLPLCMRFMRQILKTEPLS